MAATGCQHRPVLIEKRLIKQGGGVNVKAWENLHESAGSRAGLKAAQAAQEATASRHSPLRRKETLDELYPNSGGGEKAVPERKRHHHHHHHHDGASRGRGGGGGGGGAGANAGPLHHHKRY
nr:unnamed protein product [Callosobruchus analis]